MLKVADWQEVQSWSWSADMLLDALIKLDFESIEGLTQEAEGQRNQWSPIFISNPESWRVLIDLPRSIIGYWHFVCLQQDTYQAMRAGTIVDSEISASTIRTVDAPGHYNLYLVSACLRPDFHGTEAVQLIIDSLVDVLAYLAERGVFIDEMIANAYTKKGLALLRRLGFSPLVQHHQCGQIVELNFKLWVANNPFARRYPRLLHLYYPQAAGRLE